MRNVTRRARLKGRVSPSMLVACVALFFAMTGAGLAATGYRITSIRQISPNVLHALQGRAGPQGPTGPQGPQGIPGAAGPQGRPGTADWTSLSYQTNTAHLDATTPQATVIVHCRPGEHVLAGGFAGVNEIVTESRDPALLPNLSHLDEWDVAAHLDPSAASGDVTAWAACI